MKTSRHPAILPLLILAVAVVASCGYHFPGDPGERSAVWQGTTLKIEGAGKKKHPVLAQILKGKLAEKLGISGKNTSNDSTVTLHIDLGIPARSLLLEDSSGRADQYQITITAKPTITGSDKPKNYPTVSGRTTYYELIGSATTKTARKSAETEALGNLADNLAAVLSSRN
ncbi:MAG: hypothetical protein HQL70_10675 [Magnetococcales bacterium]|nr:hypothetical protein [Magnetococcales bacterium]